MLNHVLDGRDVPLDDHGMGPDMSIEMDGIPADENTIETITKYVCDYGCCQTVARERRVSKVKKSPMAIIRRDGGYDSHKISHCKKRGMCTTIRVRINANCLPTAWTGPGQRPSWCSWAAGAPPRSPPKWGRMSAKSTRSGRRGLGTTAGG